MSVVFLCPVLIDHLFNIARLDPFRLSKGAQERVTLVCLTRIKGVVLVHFTKVDPSAYVFVVGVKNNPAQFIPRRWTIHVFKV